MNPKSLIVLSLLVFLMVGIAVLWKWWIGQEASSGWTKSEENPVLGGSLGTVFDISVLKEANLFRMWFSWRPKASIALVESNDGIHWSDPIIVLTPIGTSGWEDEVNRPIVVKTK